MADVTPLFLGLTRPPKYLGLPLGYFLALSVGSVLPFVLFDSMWFLLLFAFGYPPLYLVSDKNPHLIELIIVTTSRTPKTANHDRHGGHVYVS